MLKKTISYALLAGFCTLGTGCAGQQGDNAAAVPDSLEATEELATASLELGEAACWTNACTAANSCKDITGVFGDGLCETTVSSYSPNASYGVSNCVNAYNTETTLYAGNRYDLRVTPYSTPQTAAACTSTVITAKVAAKVNGKWSAFSVWGDPNTQAVYRYVGSWQKLAGLNNTYYYGCVYVPKSNNTFNYGISAASNLDVRVSARADVNGAKVRVTTTWNSDGGCTIL